MITPSLLLDVGDWQWRLFGAVLAVRDWLHFNLQVRAIDTTDNDRLTFVAASVYFVKMYRVWSIQLKKHPATYTVSWKLGVKIIAVIVSASIVSQT